MKNLCTYLFLLLLCGWGSRAFAEDILSIRVLTLVKLQNIQLSADQGSYVLSSGNDPILQLGNRNLLRLQVVGDSIEVSSATEVYGRYASLHLRGDRQKNTLKLKSMVPDRKARLYPDNMVISVEQGALKVINEIELDNYIAGVVEAEGGVHSHIEFYKVQVILARTFALAHLQKHAADGYNLCDQVHCQAYMGRCNDPDILKAIAATKGKLVVDENLNLITAAFHSNSGGETANSEDVWGTKTTYLRSVRDSFSTKMPNARWERKMASSDWLGYLKQRYNYPIEDSSAKFLALHFRQDTRKVYLEANNSKVPLKNIRTDLQLKSTFFSVQQVGDSVVFKGRGFGHGLGMCQEGAMKMARLGYDYKSILSFYYQNIFLIDMHLLNFFRDE